MKIKKIITENICIILYFMLGIFSVLPFFMPGFFAFHDDVQVSRVYEMAQALIGGQFPVRWVGDLGYGLGYPLYNFYSVLPYYIGGFINLTGFDVLIATKAVFIVGIILSGVSMYFLTKSFFGKLPGLVAAIIYLYFPYHAVNIYVRGDLAEIFGYAFLPLVFLSFFKIHSQKAFSKTYTIFGAISLAAVILSHNLTAFMLFIFLGIFVVSSVIISKNKRQLLISYGAILILGFLLSAFYSIPASFESKYTNIQTILGGGSNPLDHFVCISQFWNSPWGFAGSAPGCVDGISFMLGKLNILLTLIAGIVMLISFKKLKDNKFIVIISFCFLSLALFLTVEYSSFIWRMPFMEYLQFPWRFLNFVGLFMSFIIGYLVYRVGELKKQFGLVLSIFVIVSSLFFSHKLFMPQRILDRTASYYTNINYLNWTASNISDEYLPKGFRRPSSQVDLKVSIKKLYPYDEFFRFNYSMNKFEFGSTPIELFSDMLSVVGVVMVVIVIINKSKSYGRKTS